MNFDIQFWEIFFVFLTAFVVFRLGQLVERRFWVKNGEKLERIHLDGHVYKVQKLS